MLGKPRAREKYLPDGLLFLDMLFLICQVAINVGRFAPRCVVQTRLAQCVRLCGVARGFRVCGRAFGQQPQPETGHCLKPGRYLSWPRCALIVFVGRCRAVAACVPEARAAVATARINSRH